VSKRAGGGEAARPPPPGGATVEDLVERAGARVAELKQATREANEAAQNLRAAARDHDASLKAAADGAITERLQAATEREVARMEAEVTAGLEAVRADVRGKIEELYDLYLQGESEAEPSIPELVAARQQLRKAREAAERDRKASGGKR
jgi:hypothetical protein